MTRTNALPRADVVTFTSLLVIVAAIAWATAVAPTIAPMNASVSVDRVDTPQTVSIAAARTKGHTGAPVALVIFSDFQCQFCAAFARDSQPLLENKYVNSNQLLLAFMHEPVPIMHPAALPAAEVAECSGLQGKFWAVHDLLFKNYDSLARIDLATLATSAGVRTDGSDGLRACLASHQMLDRIAESVAVGYSLRLQGTPSFVLGNLTGTTVEVTQQFAGSAVLSHIEAALEARFTARKPS